MGLLENSFSTLITFDTLLRGETVYEFSELLGFGRARQYRNYG
jgi:hypothetical protein